MRGTASEVSYLLRDEANPHPRILGLLRPRAPGSTPCPRARSGRPGPRASRPGKILFTGTSLGEEDLREAFAVNGLTVNIDAARADRAHAPASATVISRQANPVAVRWNSGHRPAASNPKVITAGERSLGRDADQVRRRGPQSPGRRSGRLPRIADSNPSGFHQHLGSVLGP